MTLADLLSRDIQIELHEAVALARDVIDRVIAAPSGGIPELDEAVLLPEGRVQVLSGSLVEDPTARLMQFLQALLRDVSLPLQLRLLMTHSETTPAAFSEELAFFERPGRSHVLRALHDRASGAVQTTDTEEEILAEPQWAGAPEVTTSPNSASRGINPKILYAVVLAGVILAASAAVLLSSRSDGAQSSGLTADLTERVSGMANAVGEAVGAIGDRVGATTSTPSPQPVETSETPGLPNSSTPTATGRPAAPARVSEQSPAISFKAPTLREEQIASQTETSPVEAHIVSDAEVTDIVYSQSTPEVTPPVAVRPQLPRQLPTGRSFENSARIDLVVLPNGTVGSVKLATGPRTIHDSMLLSAVKAWRFQPAMKDGRPVSYRQSVWIAR